MFLRLFLLFTLVPLAELTLLLQIGKRVGLMATIGLVVATGIAGAWLARLAGVGALKRIQSTMAAGQLPAAELVEGLVILVAGAMLLTPGLLTDASALLLLTPPGRRGARLWLQDQFQRQVLGGKVTIDVTPSGPEG